MYVVKDCAGVDTSCVAAEDEACSSCTETLTVTLAAGITYYVVVDGYSNTDPSNSGPYSLEIVKLGETCSAPKLVDAVPFSASGDTSGSTSSYAYSAGACPGEAGGWGLAAPEEVYAFTPAATGNYEIALTGQNFDSTLYVVTQCSAVSSTCLGAKQITCSNCVESLTLGLTAGVTYFLIADGQSNSSVTNAGKYTLTVKNAGTAGDTCANPFVVAAVPFTGVGNTTGANADYGYQGSACPGQTMSHGAGAPDHVYAFTPSVTKSYTISLKGQNFDSNLYVITNCGSVDTSCLGADEMVGSNVTETLTLDLVAGSTYYVIVDGWQPFATTVGGQYTLTVE